MRPDAYCDCASAHAGSSPVALSERLQNEIAICRQLSIPSCHAAIRRLTVRFLRVFLYLPRSFTLMSPRVRVGRN